MAAVAAVVAVAAYIRRLRAELAAARRCDNDEFAAASVRDTLVQQQAPPAPVAQAPAPRSPIILPTTAIDGRDVAGCLFV